MWKSNPAFLGYNLLIDPDGKLAGVSFDQFRINSKFAFEQRRHTGGSWTVRSSHLAVSYDNVFHRVCLPSANGPQAYCAD